MEYIPKSALVAEITKRKKRNVLNEGAFEEDIDILSFINTLEVKEVDLENIAAVEWDNYIRKIDGEPDNAYMLIERSQYINLVKHFFELGLQAQKGE